MIKLFITLLCALSLSANVLISPQDAMKLTYGFDAKIKKKNILLSKIQAKKIQKEARVKLKSKIFRVFTATANDKTLGYGILINKKVRSKNAVVLYLLSNAALTSVEIIAFNEPKEYLPSKNWNSQFKNRPTNKPLRISKEISTITGATLSARSVVEGSRVAFALYNELLAD